MTELDWRYNFDIEISPNKSFDMYMPKEYVCYAWVSYGSGKIIHLGTNRLDSIIEEDYEKDIYNLITHETLHLVLTKMIDFSEKWINPRTGLKKDWASRGFEIMDKMSG